MRDEAGQIINGTHHRRLETAVVTNWAGNVAFSASHAVSPVSMDEVRDAVRAAASAKAIGSRHAFTDMGDTPGTLISTERLTTIEIESNGDVRVASGVRYSDLVRALAAEGLTLANLASLPHISVGGAVATATHGSGARNPSLASAVVGLELVLADGSAMQLERADPAFAGAVVGLGALGVVTSLTLTTVTDFTVAQWVFDNVPWSDAEQSLLELLALGYSTSLFLTWGGDGVEQLWVKTTDQRPPAAPGVPATGARHPILGADPRHCTEQLGVPGPAGERLAHFRSDGVPSSGHELQSEWSVARADAGTAFGLLRELGPAIAPAVQISEIRAVAADDFWLSPFSGRDAVTFHFTWKPLPDAVWPAIRSIEAALRDLAPRPHFGKLFSPEPERVRAVYPRFDDFRALRRQFDPSGKFLNRFLLDCGLG